MKNILLLFLGSISLMFLVNACEPEDLDPEYPFTIEVRTFDDSVRVANAQVVVLAPVRNSIAYFEGSTNELGLVSFKYGEEAIFLVRATRGNPKDPTYIGCAEVRLEPNQTVTKTVYIRQVDPEISGC